MNMVISVISDAVMDRCATATAL